MDFWFQIFSCSFVIFFPLHTHNFSIFFVLKLKFYLIPFFKKLIFHCFCSYRHFISFKGKFCFIFLSLFQFLILFWGVSGGPPWRTIIFQCFLMCHHLYVWWKPFFNDDGALENTGLVQATGWSRYQKTASIQCLLVWHLFQEIIPVVTLKKDFAGFPVATKKRLFATKISHRLLWRLFSL